jgi:hypothetical protein
MGEPADSRRLVHQRKPDTGRQVRFQNQRLPGADKIASRTDVVVSHGPVWLNYLPVNIMKFYSMARFWIQPIF